MLNNAWRGGGAGRKGQVVGKHSERWRAYYEKLDGRPPRETLLFALDRFDAEPPRDQPRSAVDLGCGAGRDVIELLRRGWKVLAIDSEPAAIEALRRRTDLPPGAVLETLLSRFETANLPPVDLVNSSFALPLCPPESFPGLWRRIRDALRPGGRFSGQLYGPKDDWFDDPTITHHSRTEVEALLQGLDVELFREEEDDSVTPRGRPKHWHLFHIVARKP